MEIGRYLAEARNSKGFSQRSLAKLAGISNATISRIEKGTVQPDAQTLTQISEALSLPQDKLFALCGYMEETVPSLNKPLQGIKIPVYASIQGDIPLESQTNIVDYEEITADQAATGKFFALQIQDEAMMPRVAAGDVVIIRQQTDAASGQIICLLLGAGPAVIRKLLKHEDGISLSCYNAAVPPKFYTNRELRSLPMTIIGRVVELRGKF